MSVRPTAFRFRRPAGLAALAALGMLLAACSGAPAPSRAAIEVPTDAACAVCGMELTGSPGPRGQAWLAGRPQPVMFDSTRDFFAWVLQPEHRASLQELFVQDTARIDWQHPGRDAASFIDARSALYVAWQPLAGSMGPTFAPFAERAAAEAFVREHGGAILPFSAITPELVATLGYHCPAAPAAGGTPCIAAAAPVAAASSGRPAAGAEPHSH